jgi:hypothetical protein
MIYNIYDHYRTVVIHSYGVDFNIFAFLYILSIPFYYFGLIRIIKSVSVARKKAKEKNVKLTIKRIILEKNFLSGFIINYIAWLSPYAYPLFWGRNIPTWITISFIFWLLISLFIIGQKLLDMDKKKKFYFSNSNTKEYLYVEIIKNPGQVLADDIAEKLMKEVDLLVENSWGKFNFDYIKRNVLKSFVILLLRNQDDELVGFAPLKKMKINGRPVYSFGLNVVHPHYRKSNLLKKMNIALTWNILLFNFLRGKIRTEFIFITPNVRTLSSMCKFSDFVYPDPRDLDRVTRKIPLPDIETFDSVKKFLEISGEDTSRLCAEGCVVSGFYNDKPQLIFKEKPTHNDPFFNEFANKYLYAEPGREIVVRAKVNFFKVLKGGKL